MRGLKDLVDGCILQAKVNHTLYVTLRISLTTSHRFIQPDNSFGTWFNLIEQPVQNDQNRREIHTITGTRNVTFKITQPSQTRE
jgi:hypothetical protein